MEVTMDESLESMLMQLGLSGMEAEVYLAVLAEPGSSGYRVSQVLGKAAPNTYKALNSLLVKGAVISDDGNKSRTYSAVSVRELTDQITRRMHNLADDMETALRNVYTPDPDEGVFKLTSVHQVIARARRMISESSVSIVADADSNPIAELVTDLEEAASRGVNVLIHGRKPMILKGCEYISSITEGWDGEMLVLISDEKQYLLSFMSRDMRTLFKGIWSRNFVAPCIYRGYMVKAIFYRISMMISSNCASLDEISQEIQRLWSVWGYGKSDKGALASILDRKN